MKMRRAGLVAGVLAGVLLLSGIAWASIPGGDGAIHGCYKNTDGSLRVIDSAATCPNGYTALNWAQGFPSTWQTPTLGAGCTSADLDSDGVTETVQYRTDGGAVWIKGFVTSCTAASPVVFTLPAGYRPSETRIGNGFGVVVNPFGQVAVPGAAAGQQLRLDSAFPIG
ncbi:MAG TPA: hypothetical protein VFC19_02965 [Candidatus Limnocylindrales bacterium]|nr:hypothetical protein [Candidatus Limnocylindrales bacterium]